jgi:uncharacterized protein YciI
MTSRLPKIPLVAPYAPTRHTEVYMKHFLLFYSFIDGYLEQRAQYRNVHLKHAWDAQRSGALLLAGALTDPVDTGVLLFQAESPDIVNEFALQDPYVVNGLVTWWKVREWVTVVGENAQARVRPEGIAEAGGAR